MIRTAILSASFAIFLATNTLCAAALPAPLRSQNPELRQLGATTLHWFGIHVYDISLHCPEPAYATTGTAALSIRYNISVKSKRLQETTLKEWKRMKKGEEAQRERWIKLLGTIWPDVKSGDTLTAFKRREGPTEFYLGDRLLGEVPDPAFGPIFYAIWLDADCSHPKLRDELLGISPKAKKGR